MTFKELKKKSDSIKKYVFFGEEQYLADEFLALLKSYLEPSFADFNFITLTQDKTDYLTALSQIESVPMMDALKIIYFPSFITRETSKSLWTKKELEEFLRVVEALDPSTYLVVNVEAENRKNNIYKRLCEMSEVFELSKLKPKEFHEHIETRFEREGLSMEDGFIARYEELSGYYDKQLRRNLYDVDADLKKLIAFLKEKGRMSEEDMVTLVGDTRTAELFTFVDILLAGDRKRALEMYELLKRTDGSSKLPLTVLSLVTTSLSSYLYAVRMLKRGHSQASIAKELDLHVFRLKKSLDLKKYYTQERALRKFNALLELDRRFKSGGLVQDMMGEYIIFELCR